MSAFRSDIGLFAAVDGDAFRSASTGGAAAVSDEASPPKRAIIAESKVGP
jgi:hypothetical protein